MTTAEAGVVSSNYLSLGRLFVCKLQIVHTIGLLCFQFDFSCIIKTVSLTLYKSRPRDLTFVRTVHLLPL